jgi:hypothetical protein
MPKGEFIGCVTDERLFKEGIYFGMDAPSNYGTSILQAAADGKQFVAMSRTGELAYGFTFSSLAGRTSTDVSGCNTPCLDDRSKSCGAADGLNNAGAQRVWAVYRLNPGARINVCILVGLLAINPTQASTKVTYTWHAVSLLSGGHDSRELPPFRL